MNIVDIILKMVLIKLTSVVFQTHLKIYFDCIFYIKQMKKPKIPYKKTIAIYCYLLFFIGKGHKFFLRKNRQK